MLPPPPHGWVGVQSVVFPFLPNTEALGDVLPPGIESTDGMGLVLMLTYPEADHCHPFKECIVTLPVTVGDVTGNYIAYIYVTTDEALVGGREFAGFPKKIADVVWERDGDSFKGSVTRWGEELISLKGTISGPMPGEMAAVQSEGSKQPSINYKLIPGPGGEIEIEEITACPIDIDVKTSEMGTATLRTGGSQYDPVSALVPDSDGVLIAMVSDNTIGAGEVLRRIDRSAAT